MRWPSCSSIICLILSLSAFFTYTWKWVRSIELISWQSFRKLSVNEFSCVLYIVATVLTIVPPPLMSILYFSNVIKLSTPLILLYTYGMVGFSLIPSCIPGRIARYSTMVSQSKAKAEHEMKWETLRYLSHELRTPLNLSLIHI